MGTTDPLMEQLLRFANTALLLSVLGTVMTVALAYPLADWLTLPAQIAAHIGTLVFATGLKLSYVTRLISLKNLGRPVH
ncbi:hypothetical protein SAMN05216203_1384 [Marinobacter daqiaonensis]|uniref:Uncharacterized protein n=1 Tax=Marinobacter daqiaonensis TaxID=650891 RepID=A0A1I6HNT8_9GAMM|nr:hypothetical protein [Marinobacter daqiaonensis]SFR56105.1 hypothetical protein SAMN05216203_1384 [Marinobacter daqiaonensis]